MGTYQVSFEVAGAEAAKECISFENPSGSGVKAIMHMPLRTVADQGFAVWTIKRRNGVTTKDGPTHITASKLDSAFGVAACSVYMDTDGTQLVMGGSVEYERLTSHDASDGGDDCEDFPSKYAGEDYALVVRPSESMTLTTPPGVIDWNIEIMWREVAI